MAESLGCSVNELLNKVSSYELSEWMVYYMLKRKEEEEREKELKNRSRRKKR